jgi:hypothetical protein
MSNIGFTVLKIALQDAATRQQLIADNLESLPEQPVINNLVKEQSELLKEILTLFDRIA